MSHPKIAIVIGSTRTTRFGDKPARWLYDIARQRNDLTAEIVDVKDYDLPFFDEVASNVHVPTQNPNGIRWQNKIAEFDAYVWVVAEYNHGPTAALKNAIDFASKEWQRKAVSFLGYGGLGAARAIEQLRCIAAEVQMASLGKGVYIAGADFFEVWKNGRDLKTLTHLEAAAQEMLNQLVWWANALKAARQNLT